MLWKDAEDILRCTNRGSPSCASRGRGDREDGDTENEKQMRDNEKQKVSEGDEGHQKNRRRKAASKGDSWYQKKVKDPKHKTTHCFRRRKHQKKTAENEKSNDIPHLSSHLGFRSTNEEQQLSDLSPDEGRFLRHHVFTKDAEPTVLIKSRQRRFFRRCGALGFAFHGAVRGVFFLSSCFGGRRRRGGR